MERAIKKSFGKLHKLKKYQNLLKKTTSKTISLHFFPLGMVVDCPLQCKFKKKSIQNILATYSILAI
jgi:hypothetical protein